jgi:sec-independent protein translocase protein TatB
MMPVGPVQGGGKPGTSHRAVLLVVFLSVFNITGGELVIIAVLALIVLGPDKLPDFIRRAGRVYGEIKRMSSGFKTEFRDVIEEPVREMQDTVNLAKSWFDEGRTAIGTMDDSKWSTPTTGDDGESPSTPTSNEPAAARPAATSVDAFGDTPASQPDQDPAELTGVLDDDTDGSDGSEFDESEDDPNFYDAHGNPVDLTRVDSFLQVEESRDDFGSISNRSEPEGPSA